ncbi:MAG TPA: cell division protein FtsB [Gammaproteobacteria bacterium]|nr:cell division protein FtsB [Gammaproteobacteria bacterium]
MRVRELQPKLLLPLLLLLLFVLFQYQLWFGTGNLHAAWTLQQQVDAQKQENAGLVKRNQALAAEVKDLKQGQAAVEERARTDLGMMKKGETFYQIVQPAPPPADH